MNQNLNQQVFSNYKIKVQTSHLSSFSFIYRVECDVNTIIRVFVCKTVIYDWLSVGVQQVN